LGYFLKVSPGFHKLAYLSLGPCANSISGEIKNGSRQKTLLKANIFADLIEAGIE